MGEENVSWPSHALSVLLAYLRHGEDGLNDVAEGIHERAHEQPGEKFGKSAAGYLPQSPFPRNMWRNCCGRCRFWQEGEGENAGTYHIVGWTGHLYSGERIHPRAWCKLWMPAPWTPADTMLIEKQISWNLKGSFLTLRRAKVCEMLGGDAVRDLDLVRFDHDSSII